LAVDTSGNIFVVDSGNQAIRKITPTGSVSTVLRQNPILQFVNGYGLAVDEKGDLFFASDSGLAKISSDGQVTFLVDSGQFNLHSNDWGGGVALDRLGNIYVADTGNNTIRKVTPAGVVTTLAGSPFGWGYADGPGQEALFNGPAAVAVDSAGNVYVTDSYNTAIRKIDVNGNVGTLAGSPRQPGFQDGSGKLARFNGPGGVAVDGAGTVYVADTENQTIRKITPSGAVTTWAGVAGQAGSDDGTGSAARFNEPAGIAIDSRDNVYVADGGNRIVRKITPGGEVTTLAGKPSPPGPGFDPRAAYADGAAQDARFEYPLDVAVDGLGNVLVADSGNRAIRKITPDGIVTTIAGDPSIRDETGYVVGDYVDGPTSRARFLDPTALAVDTTGAIFVIDGLLIRRIANGVVTTVAGDPSNAGSRDGLGFQAQFNWPSGLAVDGAGNLFVADGGNEIVRKLTPFGTNWMVTTVAGLAGAPGANDGVGQAVRFGTGNGSPLGVAVDSVGRLYVADTGNNAIRKGYPVLAITASGPAFGPDAGQFGFDLTGPLEQQVIVQASSDLVNWIPLWTNTLTASPLHFTEPLQQESRRRFYRVQTP
jgi:sugar lactone lactonase YvrE